MIRKGSRGRSIKNLPYTKRVWKTRRDGVRQRYWKGTRPKYYSKSMGSSYFNIRLRDNKIRKKKNLIEKMGYTKIWRSSAISNSSS